MPFQLVASMKKAPPPGTAYGAKVFVDVGRAGTQIDGDGDVQELALDHSLEGKVNWRRLSLD